MNHWYEFKASASGEETELLLYGEIGSFGISAESFVATLKNIPASQRINLRIYSPGGSVLDGNVIHGALQRHPGGITTHIDGLAASMASVIALAGSPVKMAANALYMIHNVTGTARGDGEDLRKTAAMLDKVQANMVDAYAKKTRMDRKKIEDMMAEETWMNAQEAKAFGFIDEITDEMQMAASFDLSKFRNAPKFDTNPNTKKSMIIETPEFLALKAEHQTTCELATTLKADLEAKTSEATSLTAKLSEAQTKITEAEKAHAELKASAEKAATEHAAALSDFDKKVELAALAKAGDVGTVAAKIRGGNTDDGDILAKFDAITNPKERIMFYRAHKQEYDLAFAKQNP